jgi:phage protein, HK97 gp10 family
LGVKFTDNSKEVLAALDRAKKNALTAIGMTAEGYAKKETPVNTGRLRNSMSNATNGDSVYIGSNVEYAPYVEFGSIHNRHPAHMLQKAATQHTSEYKSIAKDALENA